jgi:hypothetical protein
MTVLAMTVEVYIPWGITGPFADPDRLAAFNLVRAYFADQFHEWPCIAAFDDGEVFRRGHACNRAANSSGAEVIVFNDADSLVDPLQLAKAVLRAGQLEGAVRAYSRYRRISEAATRALTDWRQAFGAEVYWEQESTASHGVFAVHRRTFCEAGGYDPRFVYFYDDLSFDIRAASIPQERIAGDLYHLWHPPRESPGSDDALWYRYEHEDPFEVRAEVGFPT